MTFETTSVEVTCVALPKDHCIQVPWKYVMLMYVDAATLFSKNSNQRPLTPWLPFSPSLFRSCATLPKDHCVQVPWKYIKVCGYSDPFFKKSRIKGHWPLNDLWPHVCQGHMCDYTQGSLCPSPMGVHRCMWIQWSILRNTTYYITYTHTTYYIHTYYSHGIRIHKKLHKNVSLLKMLRNEPILIKRSKT